MESLATGFKFILRGIAFLFYFPVHLFVSLLRFVWKRVLAPPLARTWRHIVVPATVFIENYVLSPLWRYALLYPARWIYVELLAPFLRFMWDRVLVPFLIFLWAGIVFPVFYFIVHYVLKFVWIVVLAPLYRHVLIPVLLFSEKAAKWLFRGITWLWMHAVYLPARRVGTRLLLPPIRWVHTELIVPVICWFRVLFT
ncbi:hypothetical protein PM3016_5835 [Paenibacillus mucilaginosus 3016]|uniref:Uncharacterized protein n=1 Tax=Paenibacillus mucilaginosus 3016 TaxID=1116391 RepID=H6NNC8_9BACL|nr:hypothetical protein [Paenibacillus mucilaginosus]AFC32507.1 hypothetical protein PM3016_5835 [Paenibacillus mucilaginosus 3016]WFA20987.1 hypothetical protein ERY13_28980 [Paenibacillus mucilaginosus]